MASDIFSKLKKYTGSGISQDENYATEALSLVLAEFPQYKQYLLKALFNIDISPDALVKTQEGFPTNEYRRAFLDLVIEDDRNFIIIEVKISAGINQYKQQDGLDSEIYNQVQKYEDCIGLPTDKIIAIFILSQHPPQLKTVTYRYYNPNENNVSWSDIYGKTHEYHSQLEDTPEKYLLEHFAKYLKEENMAGFQGFTLRDLADVPRLDELTSILRNHREFIKEKIKIDGFKAKDENLKYDRDGVLYKWSGNEHVGIFIGLWYSGKDYHFKFISESGPRAMVFVEVDPKSRIRKPILESEAYKKAGNTFGQRNVGYQVLLKSRPLTEFLGTEDQVESILSFYQESIDELQESGLIAEIKSLKQ